MDLDNLETRELQKECARAMMTISGTNNNLSKYNKKAPHNSHNWYKAVVADYVAQWGGLPSQTGPGKEVKLVMDN